MIPGIEDIKNVVNLDLLVQVLIIPAVAWTLDFIHSKITSFFENRNYTKALAIYNVVQKAVDYVYNAYVQAEKAKGSKLPLNIQETARNMAITKIQEIAKEEGVKSIPTDPNKLRMMIDQVIADRKEGRITSSFLEK